MKHSESLLSLVLILFFITASYQVLSIRRGIHLLEASPAKKFKCHKMGCDGEFYPTNDCKPSLPDGAFLVNRKPTFCWNM